MFMKLSISSYCFSFLKYSIDISHTLFIDNSIPGKLESSSSWSEWYDDELGIKLILWGYNFYFDYYFTFIEYINKWIWHFSYKWGLLMKRYDIQSIEIILLLRDFMGWPIYVIGVKQVLSMKKKSYNMKSKFTVRHIILLRKIEYKLSIFY